MGAERERERERGGERCSTVWKGDASGQGSPDIHPRPSALLPHNREHGGATPCSQSSCEMQSYSCFKLFFKLRDNRGFSSRCTL